MTTLFIAADIEGCATISNEHELSSAGWGWPMARKVMTNEVATACRVALEAGYDRVIVADGHGNAQNILPDELPRKTELIRSWPRPLLQMQGVEEEGVDACVFIGNHASANDALGLLAHTYHGGAIRSLKLNGAIASEGYFNAALAGSLDLPVIMVSGDDAAIDDAMRYAPEAVLCSVKEGIGWRAQRSLHPDDACEKIGASVREAIARKDLIAPFQLDGPYQVEIEFVSRTSCETLAYLAGI